MAVVGYKKSFFPMWALLFNLAISIYISSMLSPTLAENIVMLKNGGPYSYILCVFSVALISFVIIHGLAVKFLIGTYCVSFPPVLNTFGGAIAGFFTGCLVVSFILFLITAASMAKNFSADDPCASAAAAPVMSACKTISHLSLQPRRQQCKEAFQMLFMPKDATPEQDVNDIE